MGILQLQLEERGTFKGEGGRAGPPGASGLPGQRRFKADPICRSVARIENHVFFLL